MTPKPFSDYQYVLAYAIIIVVLMLVARTKIGYNTIYYMLALFLFVLLLLNSKFFVGLLAPIAPAPETGP